jgi:type III secretory pathway component EscU
MNESSIIGIEHRQVNRQITEWFQANFKQGNEVSAAVISRQTILLRAPTYGVICYLFEHGDMAISVVLIGKKYADCLQIE